MGVAVRRETRMRAADSAACVAARRDEERRELIEGFQLGSEATVSCDRAGFSLVEIGDTVLCRGSESEVRSPREACDRLVSLVTHPVWDPRVDAAVEETYLRRARETRSAVRRPSYVEG